jgi:6-phosphogluconolactonase (cycloisomerase 2 family)
LYAIENPNAASIVEGFSIDSTGTLTPLTPTVSAGDNANDIVSDASGKFVFAGNSPGCCSNPFPKAPIQLISYAVGTSGSLTVANQQTFTNANDTVNGLLLDASGTDLYVSSMQVMIEGTISSFGVNSSTGELSSLGPDPTNTIMPGRMALHPNGRFLYAAEVLRHHYPDLGGFELFMRDPATGLVTDTHQTYPGSGRGADFYVDCGLALGGQYLLGQALDTNKITVWAVDAGTGALTVSSEIMGNFAGLTVDPSGAFAIATTTDGSVTSYKVSSTGTLTQASTAMAAVGVTHVVTDASGKFVYAESSTTNQIFGFAFDSSTGALTALSGSPFAASGMPIRMATIVSH